VGAAVAQLTQQPDYKRRAGAFAKAHRGFNSAAVVDETVRLLEAAARREGVKRMTIPRSVSALRH
jgi:uncharacterized protein with PIN domain